MSYISERKKATVERFTELQTHLTKASEILSGTACVYATGSFGRLEAGEQSDLDVFIVSKTAEIDRDDKKLMFNQLSNLDTILVKAELIKAINTLNMPKFDADGKYLASHSIHDLKAHLGTAEDDYRNTLTGRLLLFLESRPLIGEEVYEEIIDEVIAAYWGDYGDHSSDFIPAFLTNDILRLWRTFCVNYESGRRSQKGNAKIKNHKLKHSRMLTCYSALLFLLAVYKLDGTVSPERAKEMTKMTPTDRLQWLLQEQSFSDVHDKISDLLEKYGDFLKRMDQPKEKLKELFESNSKDWVQKSYEFGDTLFEILSALGKDTKFFRLIAV
ncbi:nucleotidyltransferase domain-containing protein [Agrobacterium sp. 22-221-1]|uniref:nucleotidyltransferase domain-containing protein n=1 Tax=Agrobacterium sp. T29 TaxID=2580515 RepID=UPI00115DE4DB|nr:nucleotidyltransferase domain-containing protein [Agrobacterium sp. T29]